MLPHSLYRAVRVLFSPMGSQAAGNSFSGCTPETLSCKLLILGRDIGWGCSCATSWCYLFLSFDLFVVTLTFKILSRLYLGNCKVQEVDISQGHWFEVVGLQHHVTVFGLTVSSSLDCVNPSSHGV